MTKKKSIKKRKRNLTEKQKKLIKNISENFRTVGHTKSMKQMMLESGYSETTSDQQDRILNCVQDEISPIVKKLFDAREKAIARMDETVKKAKYRDVVEGVDKLTKNIQLLSGKETERKAVTGFEVLTDEELDEEIKRRQNKILNGFAGAGKSA